MEYFVRITSEYHTDKIWSCLSEPDRKLGGDQIKLLYLTKRAGRNDFTLFISTGGRSPDPVVDFITRQIGSLEGVSCIWLVSLFELQFLSDPFQIPEDFQRYSVTVSTHPKNAPTVYDFISRTESPGSSPLCYEKDEVRNKPSSFLFYVGYTFLPYESCVVFSVAVRSKKELESLVRKVEALSGVLGVSINRLEKTQFLVSKKDWNAYVHS